MKKMNFQMRADEHWQWTVEILVHAWLVDSVVSFVYMTMWWLWYSQGVGLYFEKCEELKRSLIVAQESPALNMYQRYIQANVGYTVIDI